MLIKTPKNLEKCQKMSIKQIILKYFLYSILLELFINKKVAEEENRKHFLVPFITFELIGNL